MEEIVVIYKPMKTKKGLINAILLMSPLWLYLLLIIYSMNEELMNPIGGVFIILLMIIILIILFQTLKLEVTADKYEIRVEHVYAHRMRVETNKIKKATFKAPLWIERNGGIVLELKDGSKAYFNVLNVVPEVLGLLKSLDIPIEVNPRRSRKWKKRLNKFNLCELKVEFFQLKLIISFL